MPTKKVYSTNFFNNIYLTNVFTPGYARTYIILPSMIYGMATGRLVELGIQNPHSLQIPAVIKSSIARGQAGMVGMGKNIWPNVDIDDSMHRFYECVFVAI
jgi:hypothetical protein